MATWFLTRQPFPHLRIVATTQEGQSLRISEPGMMRTQPGWYMHLPELERQTALALRVAALPLPVRRNLERQKGAIEIARTTSDAVVALFFASDMEQHGWHRPTVEAHETQHGLFHTFAFNAKIPGRLARVEEQVQVQVRLLAPFVQPYLATFSPGTALDEFLADLAGMEAAVASGLSVHEAAYSCGRHATSLLQTWNSGLRVKELLSRITGPVLAQEAASTP